MEMWNELQGFFNSLWYNVFVPFWYLWIPLIIGYFIRRYALEFNVDILWAPIGWLLAQIGKFFAAGAGVVVVSLGILFITSCIALAVWIAPQLREAFDCLSTLPQCISQRVSMPGDEAPVEQNANEGATGAIAASTPTMTPLVVGLSQIGNSGPTPTWTPPPTPIPTPIMTGVMESWKTNFTRRGFDQVATETASHPPIACKLISKDIGWMGGLENDTWTWECAPRSPSLVAVPAIQLTTNGVVGEAWGNVDLGQVVELGNLDTNDPTAGWDSGWYEMYYPPTPVVPPTPVPPTPDAPATRAANAAATATTDAVIAAATAAASVPSSTPTPAAPSTCTVTVPSGSGWIAVARLVQSTCGVQVDYNVLSSLNGGRVYSGQQTYTLPNQ